MVGGLDENGLPPHVRKGLMLYALKEKNIQYDVLKEKPLFSFHKNSVAHLTKPCNDNDRSDSYYKNYVDIQMGDNLYDAFEKPKTKMVFDLEGTQSKGPWELAYVIIDHKLI